MKNKEVLAPLVDRLKRMQILTIYALLEDIIHDNEFEKVHSTTQKQAWNSIKELYEELKLMLESEPPKLNDPTIGKKIFRTACSIGMLQLITGLFDEVKELKSYNNEIDAQVKTIISIACYYIDWLDRQLIH